jgi:hypothetical protein
MLNLTRGLDYDILTKKKIKPYPELVEGRTLRNPATYNTFSVKIVL